ncbi:exodeoxyribonuclease III [Candidatus Kaiserbacteria bacterium RIFCSPHIGHO2_01_FULL_50_13]|uniref:Exodeoxyribonuclease III n=1 Tax=Candidatus Kaiserbacteria bacterium RIFCSPLOWO2_01_FULL_50_24 TaxID=1798507 RepID=A0A1F6ERH8_9BACT|nr:MAG: exodeoxyribonuclease III [Candidatus Kaiserbacteria bacterium RIFCSPHIGHO2_01_FULL_50_13]OGG76219.1 MAG: exodeoxyribonuclease III [Candidatus Kaiserbacteria bacterium RIFCSPLOWO2_01_FULL_50_24]OGG81800.1 MAG: exodeoxyribonuclease III [Candidatus Kaiserbacteria bacterium RIFCSPLOWO2_02_FULL_51_13]
MKLASWNVNGIRGIHKKGLFLPFIEGVKPDIVCLQETKAEQHQSEIDLPEYKEYWNSSTARKGYAGTAIFTKESPSSVVLGLPENIVEKYSLSKDTYGDPNKEGRVITAEYKDFFIVSVYTPNSKGDLSRLNLRHKHWDPAFLAHVKQLNKQKPVIFCGDLNVAHTPDDLAHPKENEGEHGFTKEERVGVDNIIRAGFVDSFRHFTPKGKEHYTWWSHFRNARARNIGWRIDYFFISQKLLPKLRSAKIHSGFLGSDHCPISIELDV